MDKQLISGRELATRLAVSTRTVRSWANAGHIPSFRLTGNRLRFNWDEVLEVIRRGQQPASAEAAREQ